MFVCIRSSLHSVRFGQLLRCAHKRFVNNAIFTLSFILLYLFYFLFLPRMPGNSLLVDVSQYWKKKKNNIMKVYIESKNMQVQLIQFRKKYRLIDVGNFEEGNFRERRFYEIGLIAIRDVPLLFRFQIPYMEKGTGHPTPLSRPSHHDAKKKSKSDQRR